MPKRKGKADNPFAMATAQAKKQGFKSFKEGSKGDRKRGEIAEAIKRGQSVMGFKK